MIEVGNMIFLFYWRQNWNTQWLNNLPLVRKLMSRRAWTQTPHSGSWVWSLSYWLSSIKVVRLCRTKRGHTKGSAHLWWGLSKSSLFPSAPFCSTTLRYFWGGIFPPRRSDRDLAWGPLALGPSGRLFTSFFLQKAPLPSFILFWILCFHGPGICNCSSLKEIKFGMGVFSFHWSVVGRLSAPGEGCGCWNARVRGPIMALGKTIQQMS